MRLDKFLSHTGKATRSQATQLIRRGAVCVDGATVRDGSYHINPEVQTVSLLGEVIPYSQYVYLMLNKPQGYVSATEDPRQTTVLELLPPEYQRMGLFPCGRLDKDTTGLLLLTNDGALAHRLLSPRHHVSKSYAFTCKVPLCDADVARLQAGVTLEDGYQTLPCHISLLDAQSGTITVTEGKYHQIKRMFEVCGNHITSLSRVTFGDIALDESLACGAYRPLTAQEIQTLRSHI